MFNVFDNFCFFNNLFDASRELIFISIDIPSGYFRGASTCQIFNFYYFFILKFKLIKNFGLIIKINFCKKFKKKIVI